MPVAGQGSRFYKSGIKKPKPLIKIGDRSIIEIAIDSLGMSDFHFIFITRTFDNPEDNLEMSEIFSKLRSFDEERFDIHHMGAAHTSLFAEDAIRNRGELNMPLIIVNCDQDLVWDSKKFFKFIEKNDPDGAVILYKSENPKNSFAKIRGNQILEIVEKKPISSDALIGLHYWKHALDFFNSGKQLVKAKHGSQEESYVSETYNFLIKSGKIIMPYWLSDDEKFSPLGTPEDVDEYQNGSFWRKVN